MGRDADLFVLEPDVVEMVNAAGLEHRQPITPYDGMFLRGRVHTTFLCGQKIYERGAFGEPRGRLLERNRL